MYKIDFKNPINVFFTGIGGISMSGLAQILLSAGFTVSGSDSKESPLTNSLSESGADIHYGHNALNISSAVDLLVYTAAVKQDNPELLAAKDMGIPIMSRADLLGQIMKNYKISAAVSGTHGKTTTTSMISEILLAQDKDPTLSIGGILKSINSNIRIGKSDYFLTEACEYSNSFLSFFPNIAIVLNIEEDHLDFFKDLAEIRGSFSRFIQLLPPDGLLIINGDIPDISELIGDAPFKTITYGKNSDFDYSADDISYDDYARPSFNVLKNGVFYSRISLGVTGEHNVYNALAAIAFSDFLELPIETTKTALSNFGGAERRFELKGKLGGITIVDDYAHHPTEITATLEAARNYPHNRTVCVFQPHTYSRTNAFLTDFAKALSLADLVVLTDIYAAREINTLGISSRDLQSEIQKLNIPCEYFSSFSEVENFLLKNCIHGDLLITMGAGDVFKIGERLLGV